MKVCTRPNIAWAKRNAFKKAKGEILRGGKCIIGSGLTSGTLNLSHIGEETSTVWANGVTPEQPADWRPLENKNMAEYSLRAGANFVYHLC